MSLNPIKLSHVESTEADLAIGVPLPIAKAVEIQHQDANAELVLASGNAVTNKNLDSIRMKVTGMNLMGILRWERDDSN